VNYDNSLVVTIKVTCDLWAPSTGDHFFICAPSSGYHLTYRGGQCQAKFLTSRHVRMHRVAFYLSNSLKELVIRS